MNILMVTNTFSPHVGGVARSVQSFTQEYRRRGHRVLVVAPEFEGAERSNADVLRIPALQHFNGSDFSVPVPVPHRVAAAVARFAPDIVHSHHPFLLGDTALRVAATRGIPILFTFHTQYERYTHYVPGKFPRLATFVIELATGYCNLCDAVVAPSASIELLLRERGVSVPISVIPTGIEIRSFACGDGAGLRRALGISLEALVVGHVGRLAPEKNLEFLGRAVAMLLHRDPRAQFLLVGDGPSRAWIVESFEREGLSSRLHVLGHLPPQALASAYAAMDVFAFASRTETQGLVLTEAMAAGVPVVALDAAGVREVVEDRINGRLLGEPDAAAFASALEQIASPETPGQLEAAVRETAQRFSIERTAEAALTLYASLGGGRDRDVERSPWRRAQSRLKEEWKIVRNIARSAGSRPGKGAEAAKP